MLLFGSEICSLPPVNITSFDRLVHTIDKPVATNSMLLNVSMMTNALNLS